jgi:hypothetical protein
MPIDRLFGSPSLHRYKIRAITDGAVNGISYTSLFIMRRTDHRTQGTFQVGFPSGLSFRSGNDRQFHPHLPCTVSYVSAYTSFAGLRQLKCVLLKRILKDAVDLHAGTEGERLRDCPAALRHEQIELHPQGRIVLPTAMGIQLGERLLGFDLRDPFDRVAFRMELPTDKIGIFLSSVFHALDWDGVLTVTLQRMVFAQRCATRSTT